MKIMAINCLRKIFYIILVVLITSVGAAEEYLVEDVEGGVIECFSSNVEDGGKQYNISSTSAAVITRDKQGNLMIYFANDKPTQGRDNGKLISPIFSILYDRYKHLNEQEVSYLTDVLFRNTKKVESMTVINNDGINIVVMSTGFSTVGRSTPMPELLYNMILYFPAGEPDLVQVVNQIIVNNIPSSFSIRNKMREALKTEEHPDGVPYFNFEGIAALPNGVMLFGIRQMGRHYSDFEYSPRILGATYVFDARNRLLIGDRFEELYSFDPKIVPEITEDMGISELAYDRFNNRLYILTAFEIDDTGSEGDLGAYLWILPIRDLYNRVPPQVVRDDSGKPRQLGHKFEGLAIIDKETVLLVADDDYAFWGGRKRNETPYLILKIKDNE